MSAITDNLINEFIISRQKAGASNATINRSLAALRQMFRLSKIQGQPEFDELMPDEPPARQGFIERDTYLRLLSVLPECVRPIFTFGFYTGMRLGELENLTWQHVDRQQGIIRLEPEDTKNDEAREIPYARIPELATPMNELFRIAPRIHAKRRQSAGQFSQGVDSRLHQGGRHHQEWPEPHGLGLPGLSQEDRGGEATVAAGATQGRVSRLLRCDLPLEICGPNLSRPAPHGAAQPPARWRTRIGRDENFRPQNA